jgi:hypothetical protein
MDSIAVIDDDEDMRTTVAGHIKLELSARELDWAVIESPPLIDMDAYCGWVRENGVRVLVLDERLGSGQAGSAVQYSGHDVAVLLRTQLPDLPQVIVTSVPDDEELNESASDLDAIIRRGDFNDHSDRYVERMIRMGASYIERNQADLAAIGDIAVQIVNGSASDEDIRRINAIRVKIGSAYSIDSVSNAKEWLNAATSVQERLERVLEVLKAANGKAERR